MLVQLGGQSYCRSCLSGTYLQRLNNDTRICLTCPTGSTCDSDAGTVLAQSSYYMSLQSDGTIDAFYCSTPGSCLDASECGVLHGDANVPASAISCCGSNRKNTSDNYLCAQCMEGYSQWGNNCIYCPEVQSGLVFFFVVLSFAYIMFFHRLSQGSSADAKQAFYYMQMALGNSLFLTLFASYLLITRCWIDTQYSLVVRLNGYNG
jgi:hypothetical protein